MVPEVEWQASGLTLKRFIVVMMTVIQHGKELLLLPLYFVIIGIDRLLDIPNFLLIIISQGKFMLYHSLVSVKALQILIPMEVIYCPFTLIEASLDLFILNLWMDEFVLYFIINCIVWIRLVINCRTLAFCLSFAVSLPYRRGFLRLQFVY